MDEQEYKCPNHIGNLNNVRLQDKWCDVTIRVGGKELRAHKVILGANLKYFETMFSNDSFQENKEGIVTMESANGADLEAFISYAYTGKILVTKKNALRLLVTANYLSEDGIKDACIEFLKKHLRKRDACRTYQFANTIDCLALKNAAKTTITKNFRDCSDTSGYLNLDYENLMGILSDAKTQSVSSQKMFFEGIMKWIMYDVNSRKIFMNNLLNSISIANLTTDDLISFLYGNLVDQNDEHGIIKDVMFCYHTSKLKEIELKKRGKVLMIVGYQLPLKDAKLFFQIYDFVEKKWFPPQKIVNSNRTEFSANIVFNDKFYYVDVGMSSEHYFEVFDPATKRITLLDSSHTMDNYGCSDMCENGKFLYYCGGLDMNDSLSDLTSNKILRYDPEANSFVEMPAMTTERAGAQAIFYQRNLHVLGGNDGLRDLKSVEKYDPDVKDWTSFSSMAIPRSHFQAAVLDGKLYACGGPNAKGSVEVYDPTTSSWRQVASTRNRGILNVIAHEGKLLAFGSSKEKNIEVYDPNKDQWYMDREMLSGLKLYIARPCLISASCVAANSS